MRKLWIKKPSDRKGYSFWETEVSDDEHCLREDDFKGSVCFVPEARYIELEAKLKVVVDQRDGWQKSSQEWAGNCLDTRGRLSEVQAKLKVAVEALEFYGNYANWQTNQSAEVYSDVIEISDSEDAEMEFNSGKVGGKRAREALKKIEGV